MPIRTKRGTHITLSAAILLAGTAFVVAPSVPGPALAEEADHSAHHPQPPAEAPVAEAPAAAAPAEEAAPSGHGGMTGGGMHGGMQMQGGMHEGGMQGCKMMGGDHAGMMGGGMQGGTHEGGMQGCGMMEGDHKGMMGGGMHGGMMGGDHAGMKHDEKDGTKGEPSAMAPGDMRKMMHEMMANMAARADERIAALKAELAITEAQLPQWTAFAEVVRGAAKSMEQAHKEMMATEAATPTPTPKPALSPAPEATPGGAKSYPGMEAIKKIEPPAPVPEKPAGSLPAKLEAHEKMLARHLASLKAIEAALAPLYASFDDKQKGIADKLKIGPMGVM